MEPSQSQVSLTSPPLLCGGVIVLFGGFLLGESFSPICKCCKYYFCLRELGPLYSWACYALAGVVRVLIPSVLHVYLHSYHPSPTTLQGETIHGRASATCCGGKGGNQTVMAARLGVPTTMVGKVGKDVFGNTLKEALGKDGINTRYGREGNFCVYIHTLSKRFTLAYMLVTLFFDLNAHYTRFNISDSSSRSRTGQRRARPKSSSTAKAKI